MTAPAVVPKEPTFNEKVEARRLRLQQEARVEVLDERGRPLPPAEVVKRLPPEAHIEWVQSQGLYAVQYFGLFQKWGPNDKRWEKVQSGEIPADKARDMVQMFPRECPPDQMAAYVEHRWGKRAIPKDPRAEADRLVAEAQKLYAQAEEQNIERVVEGSRERTAKATTHELKLRAGDGMANAQITVPKAVGDGPKRLI